jgi:trimeric autotransporter adhesin
MPNLIEVIVKTDDDTDYSAIEARAAEGGAATGAAFEVGASAPILSLADRMRAGYDTAFSQMEAGTRDFTAAQLGTFDDYYSDLAAKGDASAADMLNRVHALGGDAEVAAESVAASMAMSLDEGLENAGGASAAAFTRAFSDEALRGMAMSPILTTGLGSGATSAGEDFGVRFSTAARDGIGQANIAGILSAGGDVAEEMEQDAENTGTRVGTSLGKATGDSAAKAAESGGEMMKNVIIGGLTLAAAVGPAALLAGVGTAVVGVAALIDKSNQKLASDASSLATQAESEVTAASAPLVSGMEQGIATLRAGVTQLGPELDSMFAAVVPLSNDLAKGMVSFADNVLPGIASGMRALQPVMGTLAADAGDLGSGLGGLIGGLGTGAAGGAAGLSALSNDLGKLLPEVGQIVGDLANGLGPALGDVSAAALPVAHDLTAVANALPPGAIRASADAVAVLYTAFKVGSLTGAIVDGTKFTAWAGSILPAAVTQARVAINSFDTSVGLLAATEARAEGTTLAESIIATGSAARTAGEETAAGAAEATAGTEEMSGSMGDALIKIGLVAAAAGVLGNYLGKLAGVGDHTATSVGALALQMQAAASGGGAAQQGIVAFAAGLGDIQSTGLSAAGGISSIDQALTQLQATNPAQAATEYKAVAAAWEQQGMSASKVAAQLPTYTAAVQAAQLQTNGAATSANTLSTALAAASTSAQAAAETAAETSVGVLNLGGNQLSLNALLVGSEAAYSMATSEAGAYNTALTALNGTAMTADQAQNALAQQMITAKTSFKANGDSLSLNTAAGVANRQALVSAAQAIQALGAATYQSTGSMSQSNAVIQHQEQDFVKATGATGQAKAAIEQYITSLMKVPANVTTTVDANTSAASNALTELKEQLYQLQGISNINVTNQGGLKAISHNATGGVVSAAATGGARGALTQIDEQGIELVNLPNGSTVTPASNVASLAAAGAIGGSTELRIEWVGGGPGDEFGRAIWQMFKKNVRIYGGGGPNSVQRALGLNS